MTAEQRAGLLAELRRAWLEGHRCPILFALHISCAAAAIGVTPEEMAEITRT